jgi:hypothetical protein
VTFLNPWLLLGLAAVSVPVIIHLLNRRKAELTDWGAMRFLAEAMASQNRRILLEEILLLALRCLAVALLVLAMARPFVPSQAVLPWLIVLPAVVGGAILAGISAAVWSDRRLRNGLLAGAGVLWLLAGSAALAETMTQRRLWAGGDGARDVVILIDASASMGLETGGRTNFSRAVDEARAVVAACRPTDAVAVYLAAALPVPVIDRPTADHQRVLDALDELEPPGGSLRLPVALQAAAGSLEAGGNPGKRVMVISDGQAVGWDLVRSGAWKALAGRLGSLPTGAEIVCRMLPLPPELDNLAVTRVEPMRRLVGTDRPVGIDVTVANTGDGPSLPATVELRLDEGPTRSASIGRLDAGGSQTVAFEHHFRRPGARVLSADVSGRDDLPGDNIARRVIQVADRLRVLIIDGDDGAQLLGSPSLYLAAALGWDAPDGSGPAEDAGFDDEKQAMDLFVEPTVIRAPDVGQVTDLTGYSAVILANVPRLPGELADRLEAYVAAGGGLWIAPGCWSEPTFYNRWTTRAGRPLPPARLEERIVLDDQPTRPAASTFTHPALRILAEENRSAAVLVRAYWRMTPHHDFQSQPAGGELASGDPLVCERPLGRGKVVVSSVSLDRRDSSLPGNEAFVLLVHEMIQHLSALEADQANVPCGRPAVVRLADPIGRRGRGLTGEYFARPNFTRRKFTRIDERIDFPWDEGSPGGGVGNDDFAVRWSGYLLPQFSETYTFHAKVDDRLRLWIDGRKVIDRWSYSSEQAHGRIPLQAGRKVPIRAEFVEERGHAYVHLAWSSPRLPRQIVPTDRLYTQAPPAGGDRAGQDLQLRAEDPAGREVPVTADVTDRDMTVRLADTVRPGIHRVRLPEELADRFASRLADDGTLPLAVTAQPAESRLTALGDESLRGLGRRLAREGTDLRIARTTEEMTGRLTGEIPGREIWRALALGAVLALLAETALARWIALRRRTADVREVDFGQPVDLIDLRRRARRLLDTPDRQPREVGR